MSGSPHRGDSKARRSESSRPTNIKLKRMEENRKATDSINSMMELDEILTDEEMEFQ